MPAKFDSTTFLNAVENNNLVELGKMLDSMDKNNPDAQLYSRNSAGETAMMLAAKHGSSACLGKLIDFVITYDNDDDDDRERQIDSFNAALIAAAQHGHPACVRQLLVNPENLNITNASLNKAVMIAVEYGQIACLRVILEYIKSQIQLQNQPVNLTPFFITLIKTAAVNGHPECLRLLIKDAEIFGISSDTCSTSTHLDSEQTALAGLTPLDSPRDNEDTAPVNLSQKGWKDAVVWAGANRDTECLRLLYDNRERLHLDVNIFKYAALSAAVNGRIENLRYLICDCSVCVNSYDEKNHNSLVMLAAKNGHHECLEWLINTKYKYQLSTNLLADDSAIATHPTSALQTPINLDAQNSVGETAISLVAKATTALKAANKPIDAHIMCMALLLNDNVLLTDRALPKEQQNEKLPNEDDVSGKTKEVKIPHEKNLDLLKWFKEELFDCIAYAFDSNKSALAVDNILDNTMTTALRTVFYTPRNEFPIDWSFFNKMTACSEKKGTLAKFTALKKERQGIDSKAESEAAACKLPSDGLLDVSFTPK